MDLKEKCEFFATVSTYANSDKLSTEFSLSVMKAINAWREKYGNLPKKIVIYRGGVGDGDLPYLKDQEVIQLENQLEAYYPEQEDTTKPKFELVFMVVTKKINTRIFEGDRNPGAGIVVDDVLTLPDR